MAKSSNIKIDTKFYKDSNNESDKKVDKNENDKPSDTDIKDLKLEDKNVQLPVEEIIKRSESGDELLNALKDRGDIGMFVASIKSYIEDITGRFRNNERMRAARNYSFYNILIGLLNERDYKLFKRKMRVLEKLFRIDSRFNPLELVRYDYYWTQGAGIRDNYTILITFLSEMANPNNRHNVSKTIDMSKLSEFITEQGLKNISRYYNIEL